MHPTTHLVRVAVELTAIRHELWEEDVRAIERASNALQQLLDGANDGAALAELLKDYAPEGGEK